MPPAFAVSGLVMSLGGDPPALQVFTLSHLRHMRGFLKKHLTNFINYIKYIVWCFIHNDFNV